MESRSQFAEIDEEAPFLAAEPPPLFARSLAWLLIALFATAALLAVVLKVPETVSSPFVLTPLKGADPVRAPRGGIVTRVLAEEGGTAASGAPLFTIRSPELGDRSSELRTLEAQMKGGGDSLANVRRKYESESLASEEELRRLLGRATYLDRMVGLKQEQLALTLEQAERARKLNDQGLASVNERADALIRHSQTVMDLEVLQTERRDAATAIEKLRHEKDARRSEFKELERALVEKTEAARIRTGALLPELGASASGEMTVSSPCAGTLLRVAVRAPGAVVREGDALCEVACAGERLRAELSVPQSGLARIRPGQSVKLLYDAFPYQRYGVKRGRVLWASPGGAASAGVPSFQVFVALDEQSVNAGGERRPLMPGMAGTGRIVVGRRTVISYALGPLRQLRENLR